ncbi:50S ribosomal protein L33 [Mycoplasma sp. Pen4]|nr:50S ribosomal protein L33 [Mycoplasma sp. Pen4]QNM93356.1 50S ribosomal protein L33 [Mycoplasma sp. Pen4]
MKKNKIAIACEMCRKKNYSTNKSNGNMARIEIKKFCPHCKEHTLHKEEI